MQVDPDNDWNMRAACRQTDFASEKDRQRIANLFFPRSVIEFDARAWMVYCGRCSVRSQCLTWGILEEDQGVWGGVHEREVRALRTRVAAGVPIEEVVESALLAIRSHKPPVPTRRPKRRVKAASHTSTPFAT